MNPDPLLLPPDDAAWQVAVVGFDDQREAVRNADRRYHLECGASFGKVADRAIDRAANKRNLACLQKPTPRRNSVLVHQHGPRVNGRELLIAIITLSRKALGSTVVLDKFYTCRSAVASRFVANAILSALSAP